MRVVDDVDDAIEHIARYSTGHTEAVRIVFDPTVISYGAQADGIVTVARRASEAAASDQVLCVFFREDYTLETVSGWETLGMRGTCSDGFLFKGEAPAKQIFPKRHETKLSECG